MAYEVTRGIKLREIEIETALARAKKQSNFWKEYGSYCYFKSRLRDG